MFFEFPIMIDSRDQRGCGVAADTSRAVRGDRHQAPQGSSALRRARHGQDPAGQGRGQPDLCYLLASGGVRTHTEIPW